MEQSEYGHRRAPYAPISAVREFFERIRNVSVPSRVDRRFLQKLNVASSNEWALLSALKFLEIVDDRGEPTHAYRLLQTSDQFEETLRHLVQVAYKPLFEVGGARMSMEDLENYFRVTSSPSQAKNAARFFREVCKLAGIRQDGVPPQVRMSSPETAAVEEVEDLPAEPEPTARVQSASERDLTLRARVLLAEKLPVCRDDWSAADYEAICRRFLDMLRLLEC